MRLDGLKRNGIVAGVLGDVRFTVKSRSITEVARKADPSDSMASIRSINPCCKRVLLRSVSFLEQSRRPKPARRFGRSGKLRFRFRELKLPGGLSQNVDGTLTGADASRSSDLQLDAEGGIQPESKNGAAIPLALTFMADRALDDDGSLAGNSAVASSGFGIVGRVVGIVAGSRNFSAGIGFYAAALPFYDRWIARAHDVVFRKDTRIEGTTSPDRNLFHAPEVQQLRPSFDETL